MPTPPIPTIGRIVLVPIETTRPNEPARIEIRPAIVVHVFSQSIDQATGMPLINVRVFTDGANDGSVPGTLDDWKTSLHYSQDDHRPGTWHWMPYQIQTAGTRHPDTPAPPVNVTGLGFGAAIAYLKAGKKVSRAGWNGKGMWLALQTPDEHSKMRQPYIYMSPVGGALVPWLASQTDMLAEDWCVVD